MTPLQRRFRRIVQRLGEPFVSGGTTHTGIISPASTSLAGTYLTRAETDVAGRPIRVAYVAFDDTTAEGSSLSWDGLVLTVKRVVKVRFKGSTVAKLLFLV